MFKCVFNEINNIQFLRYVTTRKLKNNFLLLSPGLLRDSPSGLRPKTVPPFHRLHKRRPPQLVGVPRVLQVREKHRLPSETLQGETEIVRHEENVDKFGRVQCFRSQDAAGSSYRFGKRQR